MGIAEYNAKRRAAKAAQAPVDAAPEHKKNLTVNGKPLTDEQILALAYRYTDQGKAEAAAADEAAGLNQYPKVEFTSDAWDKTLNRFEDSPDLDPDSSFEPWEAGNPVESAKALVPDKHNYHFHLGHHSVIAKQGTRGFVPAEDRDGKPIMIGDLSLQKMPKERWKKREKHFEQLAQSQVGEVLERNKEDQERFLRDAGVTGARPLREGDLVNEREVGVRRSVGNTQPNY
jgi:hypothetical protein